jgi:peptidoglycan/LPS O-acetylase OafA/YrhL
VRQLAIIDLLRIFAACAVMFFHLTSPGIGSPPFPELRPVAAFGWIGVNVFFVISGFVIAYTVKGVSAGEFVWKRFLRLAPALFACSLAAFAAQLSLGAGLETSVRQLVHTWLLWPRGGVIDGVYWTLAVEVVFYLVVAALIKVRLIDKGELIASVWLLPVFAYAFLAMTHLAPIRWTLPVYYAGYFSLGVFLQSWATNGATRLRSAMIGLSVAACWLDLYVRASNWPGHLFWPVALVWGAAIVVLAAGVRFDRAIWRRPAPTWLHTLGLATYPLYLLHNVFGRAIATVTYAGTGNRWVALVATILACVGASLAIVVFVEPRLRRLATNLLSFARTTARREAA